MGRRHYHLRKRHILQLILIMVWVSCVFGCAVPTIVPQPPEKEVEETIKPAHHILKNIQVDGINIHFDIVRSGTRDIQYKALRAIDPPRLVVELADTVAEDVPSPMVAGIEIIEKIETTTHDNEFGPLTRVEIGLNQDIGYLIDQVRDSILITFLLDQRFLEAMAARDDAAVPSGIEGHPPETELTGAADPSRPPSQEPPVPSQIIEQQPLPKTNRILNIKPVTMADRLNVHITGDGSLDNYHAFALTQPPRVVVDLFGARSWRVEGGLNLEGPFVKRIRVGVHPDRVRLVFDLIHVPGIGVAYEVIWEDGRVVVSFASTVESR